MRLPPFYLAVLYLWPLIPHSHGAAASTNTMYAHFIAVGQADATLLEFAGGTILIDAGSQDDQRTQHLVSYLNAFFGARPHLSRTISTLFITHTHVDHTRALREVAEACTVQNFVHSGLLSGSPQADRDVQWIVANASNRNIRVFELDNDDVTATGQLGLSNGSIDPLSGPGTDPEIRIFSADFDQNPGWSPGDFKDENNHSLVIRIRFGVASFLFTGDLEEPAIETMLDYYNGSTALDVDVYHVGHHGSYNGTTVRLLDAMTPKIAVISMGPSSEHVSWSAWAYGHPRDIAVNRLKKSIKRTRSPAKSVPVATTVKQFKNVLMRDAIYGTGWDGTVLVRASSAGEFRVTTEQ